MFDTRWLSIIVKTENIWERHFCWIFYLLALYFKQLFSDFWFLGSLKYFKVRKSIPLFHLFTKKEKLLMIRGRMTQSMCMCDGLYFFEGSLEGTKMDSRGLVLSEAWDEERKYSKMCLLFAARKLKINLPCLPPTLCKGKKGHGKKRGKRRAGFLTSFCATNFQKRHLNFWHSDRTAFQDS